MVLWGLTGCHLPADAFCTIWPWCPVIYPTSPQRCSLTSPSASCLRYPPIPHLFTFTTQVKSHLYLEPILAPGNIKFSWHLQLKSAITPATIYYTYLWRIKWVSSLFTEQGRSWYIFNFSVFSKAHRFIFCFSSLQVWLHYKIYIQGDRPIPIQQTSFSPPFFPFILGFYEPVWVMLR